jgi:hypothetical protein
MRGGPDTTARYDRSVCVVKLQPDGEPACEPAANRIRRSVLVACLCSSLVRARTRQTTLQSALQMLQVNSEEIDATTVHVFVHLRRVHQITYTIQYLYT